MAIIISSFVEGFYPNMYWELQASRSTQTYTYMIIVGSYQLSRQSMQHRYTLSQIEVVRSCTLFKSRLLISATHSLTSLLLRLCGFGVVLSAEAEVGYCRTNRVCRSGHKHVEKCWPRWDSNQRPPELWADAIPTEPRLHMISLTLIAECGRYAAMRFTANKIVALSASTIAA